jgi:hypothetical protein
MIGTQVPGNFDFVRWDPEPVGAHPDGASAFRRPRSDWQRWEWTSTVFGPFDGFEPLRPTRSTRLNSLTVTTSS